MDRLEVFLNSFLILLMNKSYNFPLIINKLGKVLNKNMHFNIKC